MTAVLIGLIVGAMMWVVLFAFALLFTGGEWKESVRAASHGTLALATIALDLSGGVWLIALVLA